MKFKDIKPNSIEAIICFVLYICAQDKIISSDELNSLGIKISDIVNNDVIISSKLSRTEMQECIKSLNIEISKNTSWMDRKINLVEEGFFSSLLSDNNYIDLALRTARIVAASDGFHRSEKAKFDKWVKILV